MLGEGGMWSERGPERGRSVVAFWSLIEWFSFLIFSSVRGLKHARNLSFMLTGIAPRYSYNLLQWLFSTFFNLRPKKFWGTIIWNNFITGCCRSTVQSNIFMLIVLCFLPHYIITNHFSNKHVGVGDHLGVVFSLFNSENAQFHNGRLPSQSFIMNY